MGVYWYLTVLLVCFSLIISDVDVLPRALVAICVYALKKRLFELSVHFFLNWVFFVVVVAAAEL